MTTSSRSSTISSPEPAARVAPRRRRLLDGALATVRVSGLTLLRGKRGVGLALLCLLPLIAPGLELVQEGAGAKGAVGFLETATVFYFRAVNLVVALFLGCGALGEEIEGRTLPYLLTRPVPRAGLLLGRFIASVLAASVLLGAAFVLLYVATVAPMGAEALWIDLPILGFTLIGLVLSLVAYGAFFVLLTVVVKWPLLIGLALLFLWEQWATDLPGTAARYTVQHHVYTLLWRWTGEETYRSVASPYGDELLTSGESLRVLGWIAAISLGLAVIRFRKRAYLV
jgi:ABC-type transport system involved in multi-copper enzyme maturation permease subunit